MSWSDDMRCLYCDGKLPLYRKITHGQFCSTAHRKTYWQEQERLAVERLHQTHNSLRAHRPTVPAEAILGPAEATVAEVGSAALSGFITTLLVPHSGGAPRMVITDTEVYEMQQAPDAPEWTLLEPAACELHAAGAVDLRWVPRPQRLLFSSAAESSLREVSIPVCRPVGQFSLSTVRMPAGEAVRIPFAADAVSAEVTVRSANPEPAPTRVPAPFIDLQLNAAPELPEVAAPEQDPPRAEQLFALAKFAAATFVAGPLSTPQAFLVPVSFIDLQHTAVPELPQVEAREHDAPRAEQLFALAKFAAARFVAGAVSTPQALPAKPEAMLPFEGSLSIAAARLQLSMGKGRRYPIQFRNAHVLAAEPEPADLTVLPPEIALPDRAVEAVLQTAEQRIEAFVPPACIDLKPLPFAIERLAAKPAPPRTMVVSTIPQPMRPKVIQPVSRLEPVSPRPSFAIPEIAIPEMPGPVLAEAAAQNRPAPKHLWAHAAGFWNNAPRELKILLFAIPALLVLAFHPPLPKVHFSVPAATATSTGQVRQTLRTAVAGQLASVRQAVFERAAVALDEDFRAGLDDWSSQGDSPAEWSFDATGFVRPGPLALYRPSMNLRDYQMQFLGLIDKKALSWVVRAADFNNYYVVKVVVLKPGPLTTLGITRYAVIDGKAQDRSDTIVPIDARPDMLYRVTMDVHDDTFALSIQGQMTDSWSEPRLAKGGIGFFNARGEESRVRWVQVTHQYDMLGRLCAYLAPYEIPTTNGSW